MEADGGGATDANSNNNLRDSERVDLVKQQEEGLPLAGDPQVRHHQRGAPSLCGSAGV